MKNREKYPKTEDAERAYLNYKLGHWNYKSFADWLNLKCESAEAGESAESPPEEAQKPQASSGYAHLGFAGLGLLHAVRIIVDGDPWLLAKSMQGSANAEVREYGYRMELAIEKERNSKRSNSATETAKETK